MYYLESCSLSGYSDKKDPRFIMLTEENDHLQKLKMFVDLEKKRVIYNLTLGNF